MAGVVFVIGQQYPHHWRAALESGFWESERRMEVERGDTLIFWQAGERRLLGIGEAIGPTEPSDYRLQSRPWDPNDRTVYHFRYRFDPVPISIPERLTWQMMMEVLGQNPRRGANTAPIRFERHSADLAVDLEQVGGIHKSDVVIEIGSQLRHRGSVGTTRRSAIGGEYINVDESSTTRDGVVFRKDPQQVDRGLRGHAATQNALAEWLRKQDIAVLRAGAVNFDLAWKVAGSLYVAEVKSLHPVNERNQIRLGIGEVIDFAYRLQGARRVLAVEAEPEDPTWDAICRSANVQLVWPGAFDRLLPWGLVR